MRDWLQHKQDLANQPRTKLKAVCERKLTWRNCFRHPASFKVGGIVLVHHSRLPKWPCNCLQPYFGPYVPDENLIIRRLYIFAQNCENVLAGNYSFSAAAFSPKTVKTYPS